MSKVHLKVLKTVDNVVRGKNTLRYQKLQTKQYEQSSLKGIKNRRQSIKSKEHFKVSKTVDKVV